MIYLPWCFYYLNQKWLNLYSDYIWILQDNRLYAYGEGITMIPITQITSTALQQELSKSTIGLGGLRALSRN